MVQDQLKMTTNASLRTIDTNGLTYYVYKLFISNLPLPTSAASGSFAMRRSKEDNPCLSRTSRFVFQLEPQIKIGRQETLN